MVDSQNTVIGIVDVLKLTYATLEQINQMNTPEGEGPMWNRFWNTLDNETDSIHSGDGISGVHSHRAETPHSPDPIRMLSPETPSLNRMTSDSLVPNDSASFAAAQERFEDEASDIGLQSTQTANTLFVFKFKSPSGRVHRLRYDPNAGLEEFRNTIADKLTPEEKSVVGGAVAEDAGFAVSFVDDEGDIVSILSIADLLESVAIAKRTGKDKVDLYIHHPNNPPRVVESSLPSKTEVPPEAVEKAVEKVSRGGEKAKDVIAGVPNELLLPGAVVVLAVVIVGVFFATRAGGGPGKMRY